MLMDQSRALIVALSLCAVPALAANGTVRSHVNCAGGKGFELAQEHGKAIVIVDQRKIEMTRRPSSLASYGSADGSLIIDRDYVAFVLQDDLSFRDCRLGTVEAAK